MTGRERPPVTVVTGVPRSGTSLMMQMLRAGGMPILSDGARPPDADNPHGYLEFEPARRLPEDASWVPLAAGRAVKVVHALVPALPAGQRYRLILMRRRLDRVVASQRAMLARQGRAESGSELGDARLVEIFRVQIAALERWAAGRADVELLQVGYEETLRDPIGVSRRVSDFLGGGMDENAMAAAVDRSLGMRRASAG